MTSLFALFAREYIAGNVPALVVACDAAKNIVVNASQRPRYFASDAVVELFAAMVMAVFLIQNQ